MDLLGDAQALGEKRMNASYQYRRGLSYGYCSQSFRQRVGTLVLFALLVGGIGLPTASSDAHENLVDKPSLPSNQVPVTPSPKTDTPLQGLLKAIQAHDLERVKTYLMHDASLCNAQDPTTDQTPLLYACTVEDEAIVAYLLSQGANVNQGNLTGWTPLHMVSALGNLALVKRLVAQGARIDAVNEKEITPLLSACYLGHVAVVDYLITAGANVAHTTREGETLFARFQKAGALFSGEHQYHLIEVLLIQALEHRR
jgi:hypothetical protein